MRERAPLVRYHHLDLLGDFIASYSQEFGNIKPWEANDAEFGEIANFTKYVKKGIDSDVWAVQSFGRLSSEDFDMKMNYEILKDIVGSDQASYEAVLAGRILFFSKIVDLSRFDQNFRIKLIKGPDDYCRSCAVGNHCKRILLQNFRFDRDVMYKRILRRNYVTIDELFDPEFYKALQTEAETRYPSWFRD